MAAATPASALAASTATSFSPIMQRYVTNLVNHHHHSLPLLIIKHASTPYLYSTCAVLNLVACCGIGITASKAVSRLG